jgi:hypothetical protein
MHLQAFISRHDESFTVARALLNFQPLPPVPQPPTKSQHLILHFALFVLLHQSKKEIQKTKTSPPKNKLGAIFGKRIETDQ